MADRVRIYGTGWAAPASSPCGPASTWRRQMALKTILTVCALTVVFCLAMGVVADAAHAQDSGDAKSSDKKVAQKKGVKNSLATSGPKDDSKGPNKAQVTVGIGSCVVAFIVFKWL